MNAPRDDATTARLMEQILYEVKRVVVGQDRFLERVMVAMLAQGHLLVEGVPGLAKTLTVKTLADTIHGQFKRIQFTPDLVPADLVGTRIYNQKTGDFTTSLGPVFTNLLLADDGLQHHRLWRDLEVVVVDERGAGNGWCIPAGPLREPLPPTLPPKTLLLYSAGVATLGLPGFLAQRHLAGIQTLQDWLAGQPCPADGGWEAVRGLQMQAAAAIAVPERFFESLRQHGIDAPMWDAVRDLARQAEDGNRYITPDGVAITTEIGGWRNAGYSEEKLARFGSRQVGIGYRKNNSLVSLTATRRKLNSIDYSNKDTVVGVTVSVRGH